MAPPPQAALQRSDAPTVEPVPVPTASEPPAPLPPEEAEVAVEPVPVSTASEPPAPPPPAEAEVAVEPAPVPSASEPPAPPAEEAEVAVAAPAPSAVSSSGSSAAAQTTAESRGSLCSQCQQRLSKQAFTAGQLKKSAATRRCRSCLTADVPTSELETMSLQGAPEPPRAPPSALPTEPHEEALAVGARVMIDGLSARADLNGQWAEVLERVESTGRWRVRCPAGELVAVKRASLHTPPAAMRRVPACTVLWRGEPPTDPTGRVCTLLSALGRIAFDDPQAHVSNDEFVTRGGVSATAQIAFGGWPAEGIAHSTHWADEVVTVEGVSYSARRVCMAALGDMAAEGEPFISAIATNALLRAQFATVAEELVGAYRWQQPYMSCYCPHDGDQRQEMAERLVNIVSQTLFKWKAIRGDEERLSATIDLLVHPILRHVPTSLPAKWEGGTAKELKRASRAMRMARANRADRFVYRPVTAEMIQLAMLAGVAPPPPESCTTVAESNAHDAMADGVGRMLESVRCHFVHLHQSGPDQGICRGFSSLDQLTAVPWVRGLLAAKVGTRIAALIPGGAATQPPSADEDHNPPVSRVACGFWSRWQRVFDEEPTTRHASRQQGAPRAPLPNPELSQAASQNRIEPWTGAKVTLSGLANRPELNGCVGVVDGRKNEERWMVQLMTPQGMRHGKPIALKASNLKVEAPPPPAASARGRCLEVGPAPLEAARLFIPVHVTSELTGMDMEVREKAILQESRGWRRILGLKAYTKDASYPDLYCYFDAEDSTSPVNHFAMRAFTAYPSDIGGLPPHGIRGSVVLVRQEPPRVRSCFGVPAARSDAVFEPNIGVEELRDTLLYYADHDAALIARERDMRRTLGPMPPGMPPPIDFGTFSF